MSKPTGGMMGMMTPQPMPTSERYRWMIGGCLAYCVIGWFTLHPPFWDTPPGFRAYPSSGIALGLLYLLGWRAWPSVAIGSAVVTYLTAGTPIHIVATGFGNAIEAVIAVRLLSMLGFRGGFSRAKDVLTFVAATAMGAFVSGLIGTVSLILTSPTPWSAGPRVVWLWTAGHWRGAVIVGAVFIAWPWLHSKTPKRMWEALAATVGLGLTSYLAFSTPADTSGGYAFAFATYPFLLWATFRLNLLWISVANLALSVSVLSWTALDLNPFAIGSMETDIAYGTVFTLATWLTTMLLGAIIAERQAADDARAEQEGAYRAVVEQAAEGIVVIDRRGVCMEANSAALRLLGNGTTALVGIDLSERLPSVAREQLFDHLDDLTPGSVVLMEWTTEHGDTFINLEATLKRIDSNRAQLFVRDVSLRKSLETQLNQAQKMEAVGVLAGGVAHDFNNLLTVIMGQSAKGRIDVPEGSRAATSFDQILGAAQRAAALTKQLLTFSRKSGHAAGSVNVDEFVASMEEIATQVLGPSRKYSHIPSESGHPAPVVPLGSGQLEQVLLNLIINSRDAMPRGGSLSITTRVIPTGFQEEQVGGRSQGHDVEIRVQDSGVGISPESLPKIFDPFFTTKVSQSRTGLGLTVSHGIVTNARGTLRALSPKEGGTVMEIRLPLTQTQNPKIYSPSMKDAEHAAPANILIIEDTEAIRTLVAESLELVGHRVLTALDGETGVQVASAFPGSIDLLVCDVVLPGMQGQEAVREIRYHRPDMRVLLMSGYNQSHLEEEPLEFGEILRKPFTPDQLERRVAEALKA